MNEFEKWCKYFKIKINIKRDNRIDGMNAHYFTNTIRINLKQLHRNDSAWFLRALFHELFHIKMKHSDTKIEQEYSAENFAIKMIKKFYPEYYEISIYTVTLCLGYFKKHHPIHYKAFSRIKDYQ
ncbi:MAG: hypothetical protein ACOC1K_03110 [Nanoarchaeota archaeon]